MLIHQNTTFSPLPEAQDVDLQRLTSAGRQIAKGLVIGPPLKPAAAAVRHRSHEAERAIKHAYKVATIADANGKWLLENYRLVRTAQKETRPLPPSCREYRTAAIERSVERLPLPYVLADAYLSAGFDFVTEDGLIAFLRGFQEIHVLEMAELWALKPALQLALLERIGVAAGAGGVSLSVSLTSLRVVGECQWKELFESVSVVDSILSRDPAGAYSRMDYASRDYYRTLIAELPTTLKNRKFR